eukprot:314015-Alexandrium_andersonii.AAC.1
MGTAQANQAFLFPNAFEIPEHIHIVMNALERVVSSIDEWPQCFGFGIWNSAIVAIAIAIAANCDCCELQLLRRALAANCDFLRVASCGCCDCDCECCGLRRL